MVSVIESREALQEILNAIASPVFVKDREHRFVIVNQALCDMLGRGRDALVGRSDYDFQPPEQAAVFWAMDDEVFATGQIHENEEVVTDGTGIIRVVVTRKRLVHVRGVGGCRVPLLVGVISDVTRFRDAETRAQYLAHHDPLTGLPNRILFRETLDAAVAAGRAAGSRFALLLVDLDAFKAVNDEHGHAAGDEVLRIVGERLAGATRPGDAAARLGGDEFCFLHMADDQPAAGLALAQELVELLARPAGGAGAVGASIGMAVFPDDADSAEALLHRADLALYAVKRAGRRGCRRYDPATAIALGRDPAGAHDWPVEADLRAAIDARQLSLVYQPLAAATDGSLRGFEALVRWHHPRRGEILPTLFIPIAEASGLILPLGEWVLREACAQAMRWRRPAQLAVNISAMQLRAGSFPAVVAAALAASGLPAHRLELEITETALLDGSDQVGDAFGELKALGVRFALDDFGAGWSSLDMLRRFPFDRIKIDRSFVAAMQSEARSAAIVRTVLGLGQALSLPVTAEGVETVAQLTALRQLGCDQLQGHLIGRPKPKATAPSRHPWASTGRDPCPDSLPVVGEAVRPCGRRAARPRG
jgi:diguanylate cyclase (GGDEF)-like protein/PAS domain S-box-containing protein